MSWLNVQLLCVLLTDTDVKLGQVSACASVQWLLPTLTGAYSMMHHCFCRL